MSRMVFWLRRGVPVVALVAVLAACTRAKPMPTAVPASTVPTFQAVTNPTPGATVVSVGPAPATPLGTASTEAMATPIPTMAPSPSSSETPASAPTSSPTTQYTVAYGDTLFGIARRFGTTAQAIADANGIATTDMIRAGQTLSIPGALPQETGEYIVQAGDTLYSIAARFGTTAGAIASANQIVNPTMLRVGQRLVIPEAGQVAQPGQERVHVVQPGETLYRIALQYGKTVQEIAVANNLPNVNSIREGQRLVIP